MNITLKEKIDKALLLTKNNETIRAKNIWKELLDDNPPDNIRLRSLINLAKIEITDKQYDSAEAFINKGIKEFPRNKWLLILNSTLAQKQGKYNLATERWEKIINIHPDHKSAWINLSKNYSHLNRHDEAIEILHKCKTLFEEDLHLEEVIANAYQKGKKWPDAIKVWKRIFSKNPTHNRASFNIGYCLLQLGHREKAINSFEKTTQLFPNNLNAYVHLGNIYLSGNSQDPNLAIQAFEEAYRIKPVATILIKKGHAYLKNEDINQAIKHYKRAEDAFPESTEGTLALINLDLKNGKPVAALSKVKRALKKFPTNERFLFFEAFLNARDLASKFDFSRAAKAYEGILKTTPDNIQANFGHINCLINLGQNSKARKQLLSLSDNARYTSKPAYYRYYTKLLGDDDLIAWHKLAKNIIKSKILNIRFITKYTFILYNNNQTEEIHDFLKEVLDLAINQENRSIIHNILLKIHKFKNIHSLKSETRIDQLEATFDSELKTTISKIESYIISSKNTHAISWYQDNFKSLITIQANTQSYLYTYCNPSHAISAAKHIVKAIINKTPFSFVRLGDGEGNYIPYDKALADYQEADQEEIQTFWWGENLFKKYKDHSPVNSFLRAVENADMIGVTPYTQFFSHIDLYSKKLEHPYTAEARGLKVLTNFIAKKVLSEDFKDKIITSTLLPHDFTFWGLYDFIFKHVNECSLISCHKTIPDYLKKRFGIKLRKFYKIPTEYRSKHLVKIEYRESHYPKVYQELCKTIEVTYPGEIFIIAAGFLGKEYCNIIKNQGGIALDLGSAVDYWLGYETRGDNINASDQKKDILHKFMIKN